MGYAPAFLVFGWHLQIPADMLSGTGGLTMPGSTVDWVNRQQLPYAYRRASDPHVFKWLEHTGWGECHRLCVCVGIGSIILLRCLAAHMLWQLGE